MTVETCMRLVDGMRPNGFSEAVKRRFLGEAEGKVRVELLGEEPDAVPAIDGNTPADTELTAPSVARPVEAGISGHAANVATFSWRTATAQQRAAKKREIAVAAARGEKIYPGRM